MDCPQGNNFSSENMLKFHWPNSENGIQNGGCPVSTHQAVKIMEPGSISFGESSINRNVNPNHEGIQLLKDSKSPNKLPAAIWKMNQKTVLCRRFQAGNCAFTTNCHFAHSYEEIGKPPPAWEEIVASEKEAISEPREQNHIVVLGATDETHEPFTMKSFVNNFSFLHDEQSEVRESEAICLVPGRSVTVEGGMNWRKPLLDPLCWKTRICYKWEHNGFCPYGNKCHFAHGAAELHPYGRRSAASEVKDPPPAQDAKQGAGSANASANAVFAPAGTLGVPPRRLPSVMALDEIPRKWKGPNKISKIYGDWIDDV